MDNVHRRACRFCMKTIYNDFDVIGEITRRMLDALLLKLNLDNDKESVMCLECAAKLQNAVDFKTTCLNRNKKVCRFCMKVTERGRYVYLEENKENVFIIDMVQKHIPELNLRVTEELVTCNTCLGSLQDFLSFVRNCMSAEEKIKKNMDEHKDDDQIHLNDAQQVFTPEYEISCSDADNMAIFEEKREEYNTVIDDREIHDTLEDTMETEMETDDVNLDIKKEDVEIKLEQNICESDEEALNTLEIRRATNDVQLNLLPQKSRKLYEETYRRFMDYHKEKTVWSFSENVLIAYFAELSKKMKSSSLYSIYSMLKATLLANNNLDISKYSKLRAFLKRQSDGYQPKTSEVLKKEQIDKFILEAPDHKYLTIKVALMVGVAGACRREELVHIKVDDIDDIGSKLLITLPDTKTKKSRSFVVTEHLDTFRKYAALRPLDLTDRRFFFKYSNGKACKQVIGINKFGGMPQEIASYLNLPNIKGYTGHCFRRTSAMLSRTQGLISEGM